MQPTREPAAVGAIAAALLGVDPTEVEWQVLQIEGRSIVLRGAGVIVKHFDDASGFDAEVAGFDVLRRLSPDSGPGLKASSAAELTILMDDLGEAPSMADVLLGSDAQAAQQALDDYIDALAILHDRTASAAGHAVHAEWMTDLLGRATSALTAQLPAALTQLTPAVHEHVEHAQARVLHAGDGAVFSFGDMCPDNNLMTSDGFKFIDLEASGFVHPSLDLANIELPFPTCWCCFDLPQSVRRRALDRYARARGEAALAELDSMAVLCAVLTLGVTAIRVLVEEDDVEVAGGHALPTGRQRTLHRLQRTCEMLDGSARYRASREWLTEALGTLQDTWPEVPPLDLAPAFRSTNHVSRA